MVQWRDELAFNIYVAQIGSMNNICPLVMSSLDGPTVTGHGEDHNHIPIRPTLCIPISQSTVPSCEITVPHQLSCNLMNQEA